MLSLHYPSLSPSPSLWSPNPSKHHKRHNPFIRNQRKTSIRYASGKFICHLSVGVEDIAQVLHNKVLIAAGVSAAIGQLSKPFTSSLLYGKDFNFMAIFQAGGFPSTHSSAVVATATSLAFERGFSDSIFGLTVVYAGLIMYDAQGVRREVGIHARTLNKLLSKTQINSTISKDRNDLMGSQGSLDPLLSEQAAGSSPSKSANASLLLKSDKKIGQNLDVEEGPDRATNSSTGPLKESIGHTEVEVIAGALLGFFVSLAVNSIL